MGGGDLNLKKSWHPSTFANLEKVWKAEHKHETEQKKIAQLQQELKEERAREEMQRTAVDAGVVKKKDSRVEWLYSGPASSVDREEYLLGKKIDRQVDPTLAEDARQKEALASGPGALFVGEDTGPNTGADLAVKVREDPLFLIKQKEEEAKKKLASNPIKLKHLQQLLEDKGRKSKSSSSHKKKHKRSRESISESPPSPGPKRDSRSSSSPRSHSHRHHGHAHRQYDRQKPAQTSSSRHHPYSKPRSRTRGMDPEELERRRKEMMTNAKEHDKDRARKLRQHEQDQKKSEELAKTEKKTDFLQPLRVQSLSSSASLGDRIHRNIHSVQRTTAKLDSNFMSK